MCVCVCLCVCVHVFGCVRARVCVCVYIFVWMCKFFCVFLCLYMFVHMFVCVHLCRNYKVCGGLGLCCHRTLNLALLVNIVFKLLASLKRKVFVVYTSIFLELQNNYLALLFGNFVLIVIKLRSIFIIEWDLSCFITINALFLNLHNFFNRFSCFFCKYIGALQTTLCAYDSKKVIIILVLNI